MKGQNYAREKSELARKVRPLGQFICDQIHAKMPGPPRVPSVPQTRSKRQGRTPDSRYPRTDAAEREAPILRACLKWLRTRGIFAYRQNTGTAWINGQPVSFGFPGAADITGILPDGRRLEIECKSATGKQSEKQKWFQAKIEANGGLYLLVRSEEELACLLSKYL